MMVHDIALKAVAASLAGALVGWVGASLTTIGRVDAIERSLSRIEQRLDNLSAVDKPQSAAAAAAARGARENHGQ